MFVYYSIFCFIIYCTIFFNSTSQTVAISFFIYRYYILFFAAYFISKIFNQTSIDNLFDIIIKCYLLQCAITLASYFIPAFGDFIFSIQQDASGDIFRFLRAVGLGFGFDGGAMELSLVMIILVYKMLNNKNNGFYLFCLFFFMFTGLFVARTIFIGILFNILFYFIYTNTKNKATIKNNKIKLFIFALLSICIVIIVLFLLYQKYQDLIDWMLQMFKHKKDSTQPNTFDILFGKMYFHLEDSTLLIGDGMFTENGKLNGIYYKRTDAGYMRILLLGGIPLLISYFVIEFTYFFGLYIKYKNYRKIWFLFLLADYVFFIKIIVFPVAPMALLFLNKKEHKNEIL